MSNDIQVFRRNGGGWGVMVDGYDSHYYLDQKPYGFLLYDDEDTEIRCIDKQAVVHQVQRLEKRQ